MKAKVFDVISHRLVSETPPEALEEKLNVFLSEHPAVKIHHTAMNYVAIPPVPTDAGPPYTAIFFILFYSE